MRYIAIMVMDFGPMLTAIFLLERFGDRVVDWVNSTIGSQMTVKATTYCTLFACLIAAALIQLLIVRVQQRYLPAVPDKK